LRKKFLRVFETPMKFRLLLKSFDNDIISLASQQIYELLNSTESSLRGVVALPIQIKRFCVLRSPHIDKDSREHFEVRLYKRIVDFSTASPSVLNTLFKADFPAGLLCSFKMIDEH